jgi:hypothetical protein
MPQLPHVAFAAAKLGEREQHAAAALAFDAEGLVGRCAGWERGRPESRFGQRFWRAPIGGKLPFWR